MCVYFATLSSCTWPQLASLSPDISHIPIHVFHSQHESILFLAFLVGNEDLVNDVNDALLDENIRLRNLGSVDHDTAILDGNRQTSTLESLEHLSVLEI